MQDIDYNLKPAWKILKVSIILHTIFLVCTILLFGFQSFFREFLYGISIDYFYFPIIKTCFHILYFAIHMVIFVIAKKLIKGSSNNFRLTGILTSIFCIVVFAVNPLISFLQSSFDATQISAMVQESMQEIINIERGKYAAANLPSTAAQKFMQEAIQGNTTPNYKPDDIISLITFLLTTFSNIYVIFHASIILLMISYSLIWYYNWIKNNSNIIN